MSDPKNRNNPPPDDFSATTPNIKIPKSDLPNYSDAPANDWEKTNYNYSPKDLKREEWARPTPAAPVSPSVPPPSNDSDWGSTKVNINLPNNQPTDFGGEHQPYRAAPVSAPQNEAPRYQEPVSEKKPEPVVAAKKGGIPGWLLASGGLLTMFLFAAVVLLLVWLIFLNTKGFEVTIKGVPPGSDVFVNNANWGIPGLEGTQGIVRLQLLRAGETKTIEIRNAANKCDPITISANDAVDGATIKHVARCSASATTPKPAADTGSAPADCLEIKRGDYAKAAKCAYDELDKLEKAEKAGTMFTVDQLLYAMNLYIVNFDSNQFKIKPNDMTFIARAAGFMKKLPPSTVIEVGGHTDNAGTDAKNQPLSENRANAVKDAILQFGISPGMLQTKGYGSKKPRESNDTPDGMFRNRRIEYTALSK